MQIVAKARTLMITVAGLLCLFGAYVWLIEPHLPRDTTYRFGSPGLHDYFITLLEQETTPYLLSTNVHGETTIVVRSLTPKRKSHLDQRMAPVIAAYDRQIIEDITRASKP